MDLDRAISSRFTETTGATKLPALLLVMWCGPDDDEFEHERAEKAGQGHGAEAFVAAFDLTDVPICQAGDLVDEQLWQVEFLSPGSAGVDEIFVGPRDRDDVTD